MSPKLSVSLKITGKALDRTAIEGAVGFAGTSAWQTGDAVQGSKMRRREDGWEFRMPFHAGYAIDERIAELHRALGQRATDVRRTCDERGYRINVVCIVEMYDDTAGLLLGPDLVAWLAELGASLEIDTYVSMPLTSI